MSGQQGSSNGSGSGSGSKSDLFDNGPLFKCKDATSYTADPSASQSSGYKPATGDLPVGGGMHKRDEEGGSGGGNNSGSGGGQTGGSSGGGKTA